MQPQEIDWVTPEVADAIFVSPETPMDKAGLWGVYSVLYLLRREAMETFIGLITTEDDVLNHPPHRPFATAMVLFAGIDLLAKFFAGEASERGAGRRFKGFIEQYLFETATGADLFWKLRCAITHSFGLKIDDTGTQVYLWVGGEDIRKEQPVSVGANGAIFLNISALYARFCTGVRAYERNLRSDRELQRRFTAVFRGLATMTIHNKDEQSLW